MDGISHKKPDEGPFLIFNKRDYRQSLNKKFDIHVEKFVVFNLRS